MFQRGEVAGYEYCHEQRRVELLSKIPDSEGLANDALWRVNMSGKKIVARQSELRKIEQYARKKEAARAEDPIERLLKEWMHNVSSNGQPVKASEAK